MLTRKEAELQAAWRAFKGKGPKRNSRPVAKPIRYASYREYITSKAWAKKRDKAIRHHGRRCSVCGSTEGLQVHHLHYRTLYRESMTDLTVLCAGCHANHHEHEGKATDPMTDKFVSLVRSF